jgi:putative holliday junction resolvase
VKALALDYGSARTGVAVSDATGLLARPVCVVKHAATRAGLDQLAALVDEHGPAVIVVGMPLTLRGEVGAQASETLTFVELLRERVSIPIETLDERFTTALAQQTSSNAPEDALAAAHLLQSWLDRPQPEG